jgi:hypothetical protein
MIKRGRENSQKAVNIALKEINKKKKGDLIEFVLLFLALISTSTLFILLSINLITTGFATNVPAQAGYITNLNVTLAYKTYYWHGLYGLALRVPGYTDSLYEEVDAGTITSKGLFFDCMQADAVGGKEVYASLSPTVDFASLVPGTTAQVDSYLGCVGSNIDCALNTFKEKMWVMVGLNNLTDVPATHTYKFTGENNVFDLGILYDGSNIVYVTHVDELQKGYSPNSTVNFQMLLPVVGNSSAVYYFFTDPYDTCPAGGGIGEVLVAHVSGYVNDSSGNPLSNVTVSLGGNSSLTNSQGFYNISLITVSGDYNLIASKSGYEIYASNISLSFTNSTLQKNITMIEYVPGVTHVIHPIIDGYVSDISGSPISDVNVSLAGKTYVTGASGYYNLSPTIYAEPHPIIAIKLGYNNYYSILPFDNSTTYVSHNITLESVYTGTTNNLYSSGPYTEPPGKKIIQIRVEAQKNGEDFWVSSKEIVKEVRRNTFVQETVGIYNFQSSAMNVVFTLSPELSDFVKLNRDAALINPTTGEDLILTIYGTKPIGTYEGKLSISGSINKEIPIKIKIVENRVPVETLIMKLDLFDDVISPGKDLQYKLLLQNLLRDQNYQIELEKKIMSENDSQVYFTETQQVEIEKSLSLLDKITIPENFSEGNYILKIEARHLNLLSSITAPFTVRRPLYLYSFFGIPLWIFFSIISFASFIVLNIFLYKRYQEKQKRYSISLDYSSLPKQDKKNLRIGLIAETRNPAYLEPDKMKTHTIVAGATGMGKSISAQVLIEEALLQNVAVIIFDPTAQWSGMLRKCEDKKMISLYPKFGLKASDARGFPGNIKSVTNAREIIEVDKYINPGQVQILTLNKLDPKDIDLFIANVIRQIFKSDPKETPDLKLLLVFDEVHRLLSKFGGSGEGFLQIERACREFRKWGIGLILISQVLSDFVGEVKANINTEIQTRTIEESDLERIKTKYGEEFLKSLVRAEVGVAMFQNAEYNKGKPYFINFRPILHNTRRLSDEELEKYNTYNELVEDMEYQVEQLDQLKIDVFDLKMELKLIKDKIMTGNFSVVDIYLEGLKPRMQKQWEKLGKTPKKKQKALADVSEIKKAVEEAKKERDKFEKQQAKTPPSPPPASNTVPNNISKTPILGTKEVQASSSQTKISPKK